MQRQSDKTDKKTPRQAEASTLQRPLQAGENVETSAQQSGSATTVQFTDWASI